MLPKVGQKTASIADLLTLLQSQGYRTNLIFVHLPPEKSVRRAMRRFHEEGRFVDPAFVAEVGEGPRQTFEVLKHDPRVETWREFSNDVPRGQPPRPVAAGRNSPRGVQSAPDHGRGDGGGRGELGQVLPGSYGRAGAQAPGNAGLAEGAHTAHTTSGTRLKVRYRVVDAGDLIASHNLDLSENPSFPRELQPRDRQRAASGEQVQKIAADLNPELVAFSPLASEGAPIVGRSGPGEGLVVESGNGRTMAIRTAYAQALASADRYRAHLRQLGFDLQGLREPILVRERLTELAPAERRQFVLDANVAGVARFSATEQAMADAGRLSASTLDLLKPGEVDAAGNRDFARAFVDALPPAGEKIGPPAERAVAGGPCGSSA
ncbi:MAG: zeta toxin family protein [Alphaproteobacteria bacterium]|nr:zeta toxin family protein [Alphaproteobacteria bacterium]